MAARRDVPSKDYPQLLSLARSTKRKGKLVLSSYFHLLSPQNWGHLALGKFPPPLDLERQLLWIKALLLENSRKVQTFLKQGEQLEGAILAADLARAEEVLELMMLAHGPSLWWLQAKIQIEQGRRGLEGQKRFVGSIRPQLTNVVSYLARAYSQRIEPETSFNSFVDTISAQIEHIPETPFKKWVRYWCLGSKPKSLAEANELLTCNGVLPITDQYESLIDLLPYLASYGAPSQICCALADSLENAIEDFRTTRFRKLFCQGKVAPPKQKDRSLPSLLDAAADLGAWGATAASRGAVELGGRNLIELLSMFYQQGALPKIRYEAEKICLTHQHLRASRTLAFLLYQELDPIPLSKTASACSAYVNDPGFALLTAPHLLGSQIPPLEDSDASELRLLAQLRCGQAELPPPPSSASRIVAAAEFCAVSGNAAAAIDLLSGITNHLTPREWRLRQRALCFSQIALGNVQAALSTAVQSGLLDQGVLPLLPWARIADSIDDDFRASNAGNIFVPIFYYFCSTQGIALRERELDYAYEDFLLAHGASRPTDLKAFKHLFPAEALEIYLRRVCVPEIMRVSTAFNSSDELLEERAATCAWLADINPDLARTYQEEISEITRTQAIRAAVRHVEQSKISFDEDALKKWCEDNLAESLSRYLAMREAGLSPHLDARKLLELLSAANLSAEELPQMPQDESGQLIINIIRRFFKEATSNPEVGLNCFLSMRVRHGALAGQLRSPVEQQNIISQRTSETGPYKVNQYWQAQYSDRTPGQRHQIEIAIRAFSERYDELIAELNNDYIQVNGPEHPKGLFRLRVSSLDVNHVMASLPSDSGTDQLFRVLLSIYKDSLADELLAVRDHLDHKYRATVTQVFHDLQGSISTIDSVEPLSELLEAIKHAHTAAQHAISGLLDWFQPPQPETSALFSFPDLIRIALQCIQRRHPNFSPAMDIEAPDDIRTHSLVLFSDILTILFDNIRTHSGNSVDPQVRISIAAEESLVKIQVDNRIYEPVDRKSLATRAAQARDLIASGDAERVSREGRSGFIKLRRLVGPSGSLEFGIADNFTFRVSLDIPAKVLGYAHVDS